MTARGHNDVKSTQKEESEHEMTTQQIKISNLTNGRPVTIFIVVHVYRESSIMPINATWYISQPSSTPESHLSTTVCEVWGFVLALLAVVLHEVCDFFPTTFVVCAHAQNHNRATVGMF